MPSNHDGWIFDEKVMPTSHLSQGDLIAFQSADPLQRYGLVVTADCDLQHKKHGRLITLVPVVELADLVERYLLLEQCDRYREPLTLLVTRRFQVAKELSLAEDLVELRLRVSEKVEDPQWTTECLAARLLLHEVDRLSPADFRSVMEMAGVSVGSIAQRLESQIRNKGDVLLLPALIGLGIKAELAWVRHIYQLPLRKIVFRTSELRAETGQRVARLDSPYRYRLTQLMAQVFSDIGLPDVIRDFSTELTALFP